MTETEKEFINDWQRVSPLAIVYFFFTKGLGIIKEIGMNSAPALVALLVAVEDKTFWLTIAAVGFLALIILDILALYFTFRYKVEDDQIITRQGVFTKEVLNLKYGRVQNINNAIPWYFKPFDLVRCSLDSAGSAAKEVSIPGIRQERSDAIAEIINRYQKSHDIEDVSEDEVEQVSAEKSLTLSNWEVTKYGFTNSFIFVFAGALFPFIEKFIETTGIDITEYLNQFVSMLPINVVLAKILVVLLGIIIFAFLLLCITALGAFVRFYNYELYDEGKKLKRIAGLLERQTIFLNKQKVQGVSIKQNVFARILGRVTMHFQQTSADGKDSAKKQSFIIPMLKPEQWQQQLKMIYPELVDVDLEFTPIEIQYLKKIVLYGCLLPISLVALPLAYFVSAYFLMLYLISLPIIGFSYLSYKRYGYCIQENHLIIRDGLIGTNYHVLERFKAQHLSEATSPSQRRLELGSLKIQMAYATISLPYIKLQEIRQIINQGVYLTEATNKSWM